MSKAKISTSNYTLSLNIPPQNLLGWLRRPQLRATGDRQLHHHNAPTQASHLLQTFLAKHQITRVTQFPHSTNLAPCNFWLFPKLKSPLKGKGFQTFSEIRENMTGQLIVIRTVWGPKQPTVKGTECACPMCYVSCILYLQLMSLFFTVHGWIPHMCCIFWIDRNNFNVTLYMCVYIYIEYVYVEYLQIIRIIISSALCQVLSMYIGSLQNENIIIIKLWKI